ncbi:MAG: hypothetical protein FGM57_01680 [Candidatus Taylorbacteria bacterium]|nr:hypothetical protein [Candidatus Taylorbacteria bacterium]
MNLEILKKIGLNDNEIRVYNTLLLQGRQKTGKIISTSGISSSSVYASLESLIKKGLVSYQVKNNIKYYQAEMPDSLIEESKEQTKALEELLKDIKMLPVPENERNEVNVYQGVSGFKRAYEIMASELKKGEIVNVVTYSAYYGKRKSIRDFFADLDKGIFKKGAYISMIADDDLMQIIKKDRPFASKYNMKRLPKEYFNPSCFNVSDTMVVMGVWSAKEPIAFIMRNPAIVESFRNNFKFLWQLAK